MASCLGDGRVLWPVVGEVVNRLARLGFDDSSSDATIRVVWRADELNTGVTIECIGITTPTVKPRVQKIRHRWVRLHMFKISQIISINNKQEHNNA
jgi:hypothetical protein